MNFKDIHERYYNNYFYLNNNRNKVDEEQKHQDSYKAFLWMLKRAVEKTPLTINFLNKVANIINNSATFISNNLRTSDNITHLTDLDVDITKSEDIIKELNVVLNRYNNMPSNNLDELIKKDAYIMYEFVRIHPYEDGNGRLSSFIMVTDFISHGYELPIMNDYNEYIDYYHKKDLESYLRVLVDRNNNLTRK